MSAALHLKALRNRTVPKLSSRAVAAALGMPATTYASYEDPKKSKRPILSLHLVKGLVDLFEKHGIPREETLSLAGITVELTASLQASVDAKKEDSEWVEVSGAVAAGRWLEQSEWPAAERYDVKFGPPPYQGAARFAVRMEGLSMNRTIPPGSDLECLWIKFSNIEPKPGDLVIVERQNHDLTEMTCKRLDRNDSGWLLRCESFEAEFQDDIPIGAPDNGMFTDDEVRVIGIVLSSKQDHAPRGLGARRYRNGDK